MHSILSTNIYGTSTINIQGTTSGAEDTGIIGTGHKVQCQLNRKDGRRGERQEGKADRMDAQVAGSMHKCQLEINVHLLGQWPPE